MVAILHNRDAFSFPEKNVCSKQSSALQTTYSKLHPNKPLKAALSSAKAGAKSGPYNCSCTICQWWSQIGRLLFGNAPGYAH